MMCFQLGETSDFFTKKVSPLVWGKTRHLQRIASVFFLKIAYLCRSDRLKRPGLSRSVFCKDYECKVQTSETLIHFTIILTQEKSFCGPLLSKKRARKRLLTRFAKKDRRGIRVPSR